MQLSLKFPWKCLLYGLVCSGAWVIVKSLLASDRGIDFTDESYYLLEADPPTKWASFGMPFGWNTAPIYWLCGYDIANFRTVGGILLLAAAACFGYFIALLALQCSSESNTVEPKTNTSLKLLTAATSSVGALMLYADLLRAPGYNWLNLLGIYLSGAGIFATASSLKSRKQASYFDYPISIGVIALGIFVTIPAKPTTAIGVIAIGFIIFYISSGLRKSLATITVLTILVILIVELAVFVELWPTNFIDVFLRVITRKAPTLLIEQSITGAITSLLNVPFELYKQMSTNSYLFTASITLICGCVIASIIRRVKYIEALSIVSITAFAWMCLLDNGVFNSLSGLAIHHFNRPHPVTAGLILVFICCTLAVTKTIATDNSKESIIERLTYLLIFSITITGFAFLFSFGSGHGAYNQACLAAGIFTVSAVAVILVAPFNCRTKFIFAVTLFVYSVMLSVGVIIDGHRLPYRCPPMAQNTTLTEYGPHGSKLFLHPKMAERAQSLDQNFKMAGVVPEALVPLVWTWSSGITYSQRKALPDCMMLTIFGYHHSVDLAVYNLSHRLKSFESSKAWILLGDGMEWYGLTEQQRAQRPINMADLLTVAKAFTKGIGRSFPDDYIRVFKVEGLEAWRPKSGIN
jgi:hypothetical protein